MSTVFTNCRFFAGTSADITDDAWFVVDDAGKLTATGTGAAPKNLA